MTSYGDDRVTVVIATRNRCAELLRTVGRLRAAHPTSPIIVVDNASTDGTAETMRDGHPTVELIALSRNEGAAARNVGAECATTPYLAFSDDDSWWGAGALTTAADALDVSPDVALIAGHTLLGVARRSDPVNALMAASPLRSTGHLPGRRVLGFVACAAVVRRDAFLAAGGFSPLLHFGGEETLLAYDLTAAGWALAYLPHVRSHHHPSPRRDSAVRRRAAARRNQALVAWMRRPVPAAVTATWDLARDAWSDPAARAALAGLLRRGPGALLARRPLPRHVENDVRLLSAWEQTSAPRPLAVRAEDRAEDRAENRAENAADG